MKHRIAGFLAAFAILAFGLASCDIFDPWDPGDGGGDNGGDNGGRDTVIIDDPWDDPWDDPKDTNVIDPPPMDSTWFPRDTSGTNDGNGHNAMFVRGEGTVVWVPIEGGFWGIESADGNEYEPLNLPPALMVHGLKVAFHGEVMKNWGSMYQWGMVLDIREIHAL